MSAYVYTIRRHDGLTLYVGCTNNVERRLREHSAWTRLVAGPIEVDVQAYPTRREAELVESERIRKLRPTRNLVGTTPDRASP